MAGPTISVINFGNQLDDETAQKAIRAVNRQITEDFVPIWGSAWELALHASAADPLEPDSLEEESVRGDAVLYLVDESTLPGALGFHAINTAEIPFGFVFLLNDDDWTVTLSHEALEMIIDPTANVLVPGPDPRDPGAEKVVLHAYEVCDAVELTSYLIDGERVSNFITPNWFFAGDAPATRNDFLGVGVGSFGATSGSHLAFFDLQQGWREVIGERDTPKRKPTRSEAKRFRQFDSTRERPDEQEIAKIVMQCREQPAKPVVGKAQEVLARMTGLTRTSRKKAIAEKIIKSWKK